jgi:hypothetical protein
VSWIRPACALCREGSGRHAPRVMQLLLKLAKHQSGALVCLSGQNFLAIPSLGSHPSCSIVNATRLGRRSFSLLPSTRHSSLLAHAAARVSPFLDTTSSVACHACWTERSSAERHGREPSHGDRLGASVPAASWLVCSPASNSPRGDDSESATPGIDMFLTPAEGEAPVPGATSDVMRR